MGGVGVVEWGLRKKYMLPEWEEGGGGGVRVNSLLMRHDMHLHAHKHKSRPSDTRH